MNIALDEDRIKPFHKVVDCNDPCPRDVGVVDRDCKDPHRGDVVAANKDSFQNPRLRNKEIMKIHSRVMWQFVAYFRELFDPEHEDELWRDLVNNNPINKNYKELLQQDVDKNPSLSFERLVFPLFTFLDLSYRLTII